MKNCRVCQNLITPFMSFGEMPVANGFLTKEEFKEEYFFELAPAVCEKCNLFQLIDQPDPNKMFHENYAFYSQTSKGMSHHFRNLAENLLEKYLKNKDSFVVELGCNDGIMLKHIAAAKIRHLGIDPSLNVIEAAKENGVNAKCTFFNEEIAKEVLKEYGPADIIYAANVMCHIPDIRSVAAGVSRLLKENGLLIFEDPYLGDVIEKTSYDQIYDEHVFLFSVNSVAKAFAYEGLEVVNVEPLSVHGGSMRYTLGRKGKHKVSKNVHEQLLKEKLLGLVYPETYVKFKKRCEESRDKLVAILSDFKEKGKRVLGYAATSKSTTVTNFCGIDSSFIECIVDTTPIKQGKYSPGAHIPVKPYENFIDLNPDYSLLFGWNHAEEIFAKERTFLERGGKWISYVPEVRII